MATVSQTSNVGLVQLTIMDYPTRRAYNALKGQQKNALPAVQ
jgi:hypothetical protein